MAGKLFQRTLAVCVLALLTAAFCLAEDHSAVVGKWNMISEAGEDSVPWTLVLKETDGKLGAILATEQGEQPAKDFSYDAGVIKFSAPYQGQDYEVQLKLVGNKLEGTWTGGSDSGKTSGTKAP